MINPENLTWEQILSLLKLMSLSTSSDLGTIKRWYKDKSKNFEETLSLLRQLDMITVKNGEIITSKVLREVITDDEETLRVFFTKKFFDDKKLILKPFQQFFEEFIPYENSYLFNPTIQERLKFSGIRNLLINIDVLEYKHTLRGYISKGELNDYLKAKNKIFSYEQFVKETTKQKELGDLAEIFVYRLEIEKFNGEPVTQKKIRYISSKNVKAGYDIESFSKQEDGTIIPIYIEVKAVSIDDCKFYWSRNEIQKAKILKDKYFLYLVSVKANYSFEIDSINKIKNPYRNIINNTAWESEYEIISFCKKH
jgi:hypothetical protein